MATKAAILTGHDARVDIHDFDIEQRRNGLGNLLLIRLEVDGKNVLIAKFANQCRLLAHDRTTNNIFYALHPFNLASSLLRPSRVTTTPP